MNLDCTDPAKLDAIVSGAATWLLILNGIFCISVVQLRGWLALLPLSFAHIYALLGALFLLWVLALIFPDALAHSVVRQSLLWGLNLILFALAVGWGQRQFGFSWGMLAMQLIMLGLTLVIFIVAANTPDSSEVTWPYCGEAVP